MIRAKLNDNYGNEFLTTQSGQVFYKKGNKYNKPSDFQEVDMNNLEIVGLINQGILVVGTEQKSEETVEKEATVISATEEIKVDDNPSPEDKIEPKPEIVKDNLFDESMKEVKTKTNDEVMAENQSKGLNTDNSAQQ